MDPITSLQNPRIKNAVKLRDPRQRRRQDRILIDGVREITRAFHAGVQFVEVFVCDSLCSSPECRRLLDELAQAEVPLVPTVEAVFARLAFGDRAEGIVAVARLPARRLEDLRLPDGSLIAILEGIEKPGNVGAVLRSADGAGVAAVIVAGGGTDLFNPNCIRASLGTIFTTPVCSATSDEVRIWLQAGTWRVIATRVDAQLDYTSADYRGRTAIVLGSEAAGLSPTWQGDDVQAVRLPMLGTADSLNVSATAAVLFYEALRQRTALASESERGASAP
jgi:TrmH family RNA methyltransferase